MKHIIALVFLIGLCGLLSCDSGTVRPLQYTPMPNINGMKQIPAGTFQMGLGSGDTVHTVTLSAFAMDSTDVTQEDYQLLMGVNPSHFTGDVKRPVENVTWFDAVLYCNKRSKLAGKDSVYSYTATTGTPGFGCTGLADIAIDYTKNGYRLPTEAEWEYACRAGTTTDYYWGNDTSLSIMGQYAWYIQNSGGTTHAVATKLPNTWGLYDMSGNVWQWCNDWYAQYNSATQTNPTGALSGNVRILRGGDRGNGTKYKYYYYLYPLDLRSASRGSSFPDDRYGFDLYGFRCVVR